VHYGDGVQAAFYDDLRVLTISLHQHPAALWPGTGLPSETVSAHRAARR
jgi:acetoin utilization protein AcuC